MDFFVLTAVARIYFAWYVINSYTLFGKAHILTQWSKTANETTWKDSYCFQFEDVATRHITYLCVITLGPHK